MTDELKTKIKAIADRYFSKPEKTFENYDDTLDELSDAQDALREIRELVKGEEPKAEPEPDAPSTKGMKLWRVTVEQVCSETVHVWAKTLKEARDAVNEDLGDYESQVHCWELDEVESTEVYEGEPTDSDSDYEEDPDDVHGNIYTVKDGKLADLD